MIAYFFIQNCFKCDYHHYSTVAFGVARWVAAWKRLKTIELDYVCRSWWWLQVSVSQAESVLNLFDLFYQNDPTSKEGPVQVPSSSSLNGCDLNPPTQTQTSQQQCSDLTALFFIFWPSFFKPQLGRTRPYGQVMSSHSILSSSRTIMPGSPWEGRWIGHWRTTWSTVCSSAPHSGRRGGHVSFVQAGVETLDTGAEAVQPDPGASWEGSSRGVGCRCRGWISFFCCRKKVRKTYIKANVRQITKMSQLKITEIFQWKKQQVPAPKPEPAGRFRSATRDVSFLRSVSRCGRFVSDLSNVTPRYLGSWATRIWVLERPVQRYSEVFGFVSDLYLGSWTTCPTLLRGIWVRSRRVGFRCCGWLLIHV